MILLLESKQEMLTWALAIDGMRMIRVNDGSADSPAHAMLRSYADSISDQVGGGLLLGRGHQEPAPPVALQGAFTITDLVVWALLSATRDSNPLHRTPIRAVC